MKLGRQLTYCNHTTNVFILNSMGNPDMLQQKGWHGQNGILKYPLLQRGQVDIAVVQILDDRILVQGDVNRNKLEEGSEDHLGDPKHVFR